MKKELIPILASYIGCGCVYTFGGDIKSRPLDTHILDFVESRSSRDTKFKLHLRKPQSITDEELMELANKICGTSFDLKTIDKDKRAIEDIDYDCVVYVDSAHIELGEYYGSMFAEATNFLRSIGICVDEILLKEGLVEWIE